MVCSGVDEKPISLPWERPMKALSLSTMAMALLASHAVAHPAQAQAQSPALTGKVVSDPEGPMEGVLVSARRSNATITVTVVSDAKGAYSFPASRLEPGGYTWAIRAAGYVLDGTLDIDIAQGRPKVADLKLKPAATRPDQIANAEWIM